MHTICGGGTFVVQFCAYAYAWRFYTVLSLPGPSRTAPGSLSENNKNTRWEGEGAGLSALLAVSAGTGVCGASAWRYGAFTLRILAAGTGTRRGTGHGTGRTRRTGLTIAACRTTYCRNIISTRSSSKWRGSAYVVEEGQARLMR